MSATETKNETREQALNRIAAIPADELLHDFHEASKDLQAAEIAVNAGEVQYRYRIDGNKKQLQVIQAEIKRRIEVADDLLAACKTAQTFLEMIGNPAPHPWMQIRDAVRKAEGRAS